MSVILTLICHALTRAVGDAAFPMDKPLDSQGSSAARTGLEQAANTGHIVGMKTQRPPQLDMTIDGEFVSRPKPPVSTRIMFWALVVAIIAGGLSLAALALWVALIILPVALGAAVVAWAMFRYRMWRAQHSVSGQRNLWRP